ncbi:hypothetical protein EsH8_I_000413 [Colletotrichum jinshuiense]
MAEWHDPACRRLDIFTSGGISCCLSCGSVQPDTEGSPTPDDAGTPPVYQPLESKTDVRLLTLEPGEFEDPVRCSLSLSNTSDRVEYDAISYTWAGEDGAMDWTASITLNGRGFSATPNCVAALRRVRSRGAPKVVWIDAVCMNQADVEERGHQVRLMPQIYSRAQQVLVYVGEAVPEEERLFRFLADAPDPDAPRLPLQSALETLLTRRYFSRAWILQEVALARRATLVCGGHSLPWAALQIPRLASRGLLINAQERPRLPNLLQMPSVLQLRTPAYRDSSDLLGLLDVARQSHASDPRDKLFAVYGLISGAESDGIVADYAKSTREVYMHMAGWIAQRFGLPALLVRSFHVDAYGNREEAARGYQTKAPVPWWTPDWIEKPATLTWPVLEDIHRPPRAGFAPAGLPVQVNMVTDSLRFPALRLGNLADLVVEHSSWTRSKSPPDAVFSARPWSYTALQMREGKRSCGQEAFVFWKQSEVDPRQLRDPEVERKLFELPSVRITPDDAGFHRWYRHVQVYLVPGPDEYRGFSFEEPGNVSVCCDEPSCTWIHDDRLGRETVGTFSKYALCCRDLGRGDVRVEGLLHMDGLAYEGVWRTGNFEHINMVGEDLAPYPARELSTTRWQRLLFPAIEQRSEVEEPEPGSALAAEDDGRPPRPRSVPEISGRAS